MTFVARTHAHTHIVILYIFMCVLYYQVKKVYLSPLTNSSDGQKIRVIYFCDFLHF